jgi:Uma2 family endonuclease
MNAIRKRPPLMTVEAFLDWQPPDGRMWQLVDGQPRAMAPASVTHAFIQFELGRLIGNHLIDGRVPCRVVGNAGTQPHVNADQNVRIPDLAVTCDPVPPGTKLMGRPLLIIEILSASNRAETWSNVWTYTSQPSVREIVVVSSLAMEAHVLRRMADGAWPATPTRLTEGDLVFESIDLTLPLAAIYRDTGLRPPASKGAA